MNVSRPFAALAVLACAGASAATPQPEFHAFDGAKAASAKSAIARDTAAVPAPHKHVLKAVTRADGSIVMTCAAETNPKFVVYERERRATQER